MEAPIPIGLTVQKLLLTVKSAAFISFVVSFLLKASSTFHVTNNIREVLPFAPLVQSAVKTDNNIV